MLGMRDDFVAELSPFDRAGNFELLVQGASHAPSQDVLERLRAELVRAAGR